MKLEVKSISSPDIKYGEIPNDDEVILITSTLRIMGTDDCISISFAVLTADYIKSLNAACWGFGKLIVPEFNWDQIRNILSSEIGALRNL